MLNDQSDNFALFYFTGCVTTADGSALLKLGNTTVMCGIKAVRFYHELLKNCDS